MPNKQQIITTLTAAAANPLFVTVHLMDNEGFDTLSPVTGYVAVLRTQGVDSYYVRDGAEGELTELNLECIGRIRYSESAKSLYEAPEYIRPDLRVVPRSGFAKGWRVIEFRDLVFFGEVLHSEQKARCVNRACYLMGNKRS